jgi:hypothetical protein
MKPETKLKLRKWALMTLRAIVWNVDEWLHAQELRLRKDLEQLGTARGVVTSLPPKPRPQFGSGDGAASVKRAGELRASAPTDLLAIESPCCEEPLTFTRKAQSPVTRATPSRGLETFDQWEMRKSGVAVISKKEARRRGMPASAFDLRFSSHGTL